MDAMITREVQADEWHRVEGVNGAVVAMCERQPLNILGAAYRASNASPGRSVRACEASQVVAVGASRSVADPNDCDGTNVCDVTAYEVCPKT